MIPTNILTPRTLTIETMTPETLKIACRQLGMPLIDWVPIASGTKPKIPTGKHGVQVHVTLYDHVFEEICPGSGTTVEQASWDGEIFRQFDSDGPFDIEDGGDVVIAWAYFIKPYRKNITGDEINE